MTIAQSDEPTPQDLREHTPRKPLRLWPGVALVVLQWVLWFGLPIFSRETGIIAVLGGFACGLAVVVWWLLFSRAPWVERLGAILLMIVTVIVSKRLVHASINNGMMGMMLPVFVIPFFSLALVGWAVASRRLATMPRRASLVAAILLVCAGFMLVRTGGITGDADSDIHWRWSKTPEERLLATAADEPTVAPTTAAVAKTGTNWPGFRGPDRDGIVRGVRIETDWSKSPPVELWRRPIGPAWSSFAVSGDLLYTQEQRGDEEVVSCYSVATGKPIWKHKDTARFWESNGGAGPRGTPTLSNGRVYTFGGTGIVNALDAGTGALVWSRNAASDTKVKVPMWGFSSSPLVVGDVVVIATAGTLAAYDAATGAPRWVGANGGGGYSSPQLATIQGVQQVLMLNAGGATSVTPSDGKQLWQHSFPASAQIVQPALTADGDVLVSEGEGNPMHRIALAHGPGGWTVAERWISEGLNPYFNDFVVHNGHAFGFDNSSIACIDLKDGTRKWKGGQYGHGQLVLLADEDLLLVLSEEGDLALVRATPDQFTELARFSAIKGKTWNHPVLVGDVLLVRNGEEMAAFRLALAGR